VQLLRQLEMVEAEGSSGDRPRPALFNADAPISSRANDPPALAAKTQVCNQLAWAQTHAYILACLLATYD
jgi:hypothetical protein